MTETDKAALDPRTCPLSDFEGKTWAQIPPEGQRRIFCAYQTHFDTLDARKRALGYCVIMGGIAPRHIGTLDAVIVKDRRGGRGFGLSIGGHICLIDDGRLISALDDYILNDPRFIEIADGIKSGERAVAPLFVAAYNGKHESLKDCVTFIFKAGRAIGFNARKIRLNHMTDDPIRVLPWKQDDPDLPHKPVGFFGDLCGLQTGDNAICEMRGERQSRTTNARHKNAAYFDRQEAGAIATALETHPPEGQNVRGIVDTLRKLSDMDRREVLDYLEKLVQNQ